MAGCDKNRKNGSYNKFDGKRSERGAFGTVHGKFIINHYNSLGKKIFTNFRKLFSQKFVNRNTLNTEIVVIGESRKQNKKIR